MFVESIKGEGLGHRTMLALASHMAEHGPISSPTTEFGELLMEAFIASEDFCVVALDDVEFFIASHDFLDHRVEEEEVIFKEVII